MPTEEIVKGFEFAKGNYVILEDIDLESIKLESRRTIEIKEFVPAKQIDTRYIERPYIVPEDEVCPRARRSATTGYTPGMPASCMVGARAVRQLLHD